MNERASELVNIRFEPSGLTAKSRPGTALLDAALEAGVHINASCGGKGVCGKCRVLIEEGEVQGGISEKLSQKDREQGIRLACQAKLTGDVTVRVTDESALNKDALIALASGPAQQATLIGAEQLRAEDRYQPAVEKIMVQAQPATLADNRNDVDRLLMALKEKGEHRFALEYEAIRELPGAWRKGDWQATATVLRAVYGESGHNHILRVEPGDASAHNIAVAVDLGTTTVWAQFIDLNSGEVLGTEGDFNSQIGFGEDVITRIVYAGKPGGMRRLQEAASKSINGVIKTLARNTNVDLDHISICLLAGNTTMTQLFLEMDPQYIRLEPYVPTAAYYPPLKASRFGLALPDHVGLLVFPSVASYVGGDVVAGVMGTGMHKDERLTLFIDLGTNGEVVVGNKDWLACAAASAGPAFEGGGIKFGMRAAKGAIENFSVNPVTGEPAVLTVGRALPKGICGSGLIAAVAALFMAGIMDERGRFNLDHPSDRVRDGEDGPEYVMVWAEDADGGRDITLTEPDIDNLMRAKGAMYAAYMTLLAGVGLSIQDLERVILAGGFGQSINLERSQIIGLMPELPADRFTFVGNGSLLGARLACMSNSLRAEVGEIVEKMTNFELSVAPGYMDNYTSSLFLPHTECERLFPVICGRLKEARQALRELKN